MLDTTRLGCGLVRVYSEMLIDHDKGVETPVTLELDRHYTLTKEKQMVKKNLYGCTVDHCATAPYICQIYNHRKWKPSAIGYWLSFDFVLWKLHDWMCPDLKQMSKDGVWMEVK